MDAKLLKFLSVAASAIELFALIGLIVITNDKPTPFVFDNLLRINIALLLAGFLLFTVNVKPLTGLDGMNRLHLMLALMIVRGILLVWALCSLVRFIYLPM